MRKIATLSMVAAASLFVAACGGSEPAATDNAVTEMNAMDAMEGTTNDAMTNVDAATGADANMAMDNMSGSNMMMDNSMAANSSDMMSNSTK